MSDPYRGPLPMAKPSSTTKQLRFLVIGAGSRGNAYGRAVTTATSGVIHAVAEPHAFKRREFGRNYIWGATGKPADGQEFSDWKDWLRWELARREERQTEQLDGVDGVFICTLDEMHVEIVHAIAPLGLHILCEKPLALSLDDCLSVYRSLLLHSPAPTEEDGSSRSSSSSSSSDSARTTTTTTTATTPSKIFSIGHVLRYSPHNILLRKLLLSDRVLGDIVSLEHCEPVGWWHFAHSYVRGNWRRATAAGDGSLLTKSCHDIDFILWLLCSPPPGSKPGAPPHHPQSISSAGTLTQFRRTRKPALAGAATNCLSCAAAPECNYSALKIYRDLHLRKKDLDWPVNIVCPDIEDTFRAEGMDAAEKVLLGRLAEDYDTTSTPDEQIAARPWYGRCVYEADNDVCDDQVVTISWDDEEEDEEETAAETETTRRIAKTAVFHMIAPTEKQCERRGRVYGTRGELTYDSRTITIYSFATKETTVIEVPRQPLEEKESHGGGDYGLARSFVRAVDAVENEGWHVSEAQSHFVGCTLEEAVRSHAVVFAAEEARRDEKVVKWKQWWAGKLADAAVPTVDVGSGSS